MVQCNKMCNSEDFYKPLLFLSVCIYNCGEMKYSYLGGVVCNALVRHHPQPRHNK